MLSGLVFVLIYLCRCDLNVPCGRDGLTDIDQLHLVPVYGLLERCQNEHADPGKGRSSFCAYV